MNRAGSFAACLLLAIGATGAQGQSSAPPDAAESETPLAPSTEPAAGRVPIEGAYELSFTPKAGATISFDPYLWATSFDGELGLAAITIGVDESFIDIAQEADTVFGLMGAVDLEYRRFILQLNASWVTADLSGKRGIFDGGSVEADVDLQAAWAELFGGYRFIDRPLRGDPESPGRFALDGYAGFRYTSIDVDTTYRASASVTLPDGETIDVGGRVDRNQSEEWFEPMVGLRAIIGLDDHWTIALRGDIGFAWQTSAVVGYRWDLDGWNLSLYGGYRALGQDYSNDAFTWDVVTHGVILGASFSFSF